MENKMQARY